MSRSAPCSLAGRLPGICLAALIICLSFSADTAGAQNLLPNEGFDTNLDGWTGDTYQPDWSAMDADAAPDSGSARYLHAIDAGGVFLLSPCIPVAAAASYTVRADLRLTPSDGGGVALFVRSYTTTDCSGDELAVSRPFRLLGNASDGQWNAFESSYASPADAVAVQVEISIGGNGDLLETFVDNVAFCLAGTCDGGGSNLAPCVEGPEIACLLDGRFEVTVEWRDFQDGTGTGKLMDFQGARAASDESAFFWFFGPTNFEMGVKMVDACAPPFNHFWVFVSGLTNVSYQLRVRDTETGAERAYSNPLGTLPQTMGDVEAFACQP